MILYCTDPYFTGFHSRKGRNIVYHSFFLNKADNIMSPTEHDSSNGLFVGEFGGTPDDDNRSRRREGTLHTPNTAPSTSKKYRLVIKGRESTPRRSKAQRKGFKRVARDVQPGVDQGGQDLVELLSSQEPSNSPTKNSAKRRNASRVVDLTRDDGEFEVVSSTVRKTPVPFPQNVTNYATIRTTAGGSGIHRLPHKVPLQTTQLSTTLQMMMGNANKEEEDTVVKNPQCGICFEAMGKNTNKPMAAGNCGHVYCKQCLSRAVKQRKKCPGCSAKMTGKQIRNIFFDL